VKNPPGWSEAITHGISTLLPMAAGHKNTANIGMFLEYHEANLRKTIGNP